MHSKKYFQGFTLIELMTVVTIILILATVGFISYSEYISTSRDTNRSAQLVSIYDALNSYSSQARVPDPDGKIDIKATSGTYAYQGYAGENILNAIGFKGAGKDPKDNVYYTLVMTKDRKYFQLMAFLENKESLLASVIPSAYAAVDYADRAPTVYGAKIGALVDEQTGSPVQEIDSIVLAGNIDISYTSTTYVAYLSNTEKVVGDNTVLPQIVPNKDCKRIMEMGGSRGDGVYSINPDGTAEIDAYCDMTTNGGGWTLVYKTTDSASNLTGSLTVSEGYPNWDSDQEYKMRISLWDNVSNTDAMAKNVRIDGATWSDISAGRVVSAATSGSPAVNFTGTDTYKIFGAGTSSYTHGAIDGTYFWQNSGGSTCDRCANISVTATYGSPGSAPLVKAANSSYTEGAIEGAGGTDDGNWHRLKKMGIFLR